MGISGDLPILLLRIGDVADLAIVAQGAAHAGIHARPRHDRRSGRSSTSSPSSYVQDLQTRDPDDLRKQPPARQGSGPRQHIFAVRRDLIGREGLRHPAGGRADRPAHPQRHHLRPDRASRRGLGRDACAGGDAVATAGASRASAARAAIDAALSLTNESEFWNGFGGFDGDGRHYVVAHACRRADAAALDQRHRQRDDSASTSRPRARLYLEPQQPRLPADAVVERSGDQPAGRGDPASATRPAVRRSRRSPPCRDDPLTYETRHGRGNSMFREARTAGSRPS